MRWLSVPVINPIHADAAYVSRDNDRPENCLKTSFAEAMVPQHSQCVQRLCTVADDTAPWSDADIVSVNVTPSTFSVVPRVISGSGGSGWMRCRRLWQRTVRIKVVDPLCPPTCISKSWLRHCGDAMCLVVPYFRLCG